MGFTRGDAFGGTARQYWQAGGDPSVAWDTKGNAYQSCLVFKRGARRDPEPGRVERLLRLPLDRHDGASWNFPARPVAEFNDPTGEGDDAARQAVHDDRRPPRQPVPGPHLRDLDPVRAGRHRLHLRGLLARLRRVVQLAEAGQHDELAVLEHARHTDAAGHAATRTSSRSRSPGPTARSTWSGTTTTSPACGRARATRGRRRRRRSDRRRAAGGDRQPRPGAARQVDRRRQHLLPAGEGRRLLRPARLRDLPGRQDPGVGLRAGEGRDTRTRSSAPPTTRRRRVNPRDPNEIDVTFGSYINRHSNEQQRLRAAGLQPGHLPAALRRRQDGRAPATTTS